ncbi:Cytoplasmic dynein 1 light intermediate chain 1 [Grifola frondosa]|uniref:Cytoplasmic dynein 1 light intermediate chain 1 n=1 Tax=Grifola frondosa TaxID=5627 RepID=A0A1C7M077_GRIFR|nr:Cytoplasmic dynein 1 light intermediate chain 1 [Grifola frondosa]
MMPMKIPLRDSLCIPFHHQRPRIPCYYHISYRPAQELQTWLEWIEKWVQGDNSRELEIVREENRERWQAHLQHYSEPSADPLPTTSTVSNTLLPLDEGHDIIGTTSGMGGMVKGKGGEWEERTDSVMQVLRTICLKYGAALFYTTPQPSTLQDLRQYALHVLFTPPAPSPSLLSSTDVAAPIRNPFPFQHKPNTLDRDKIVVPAGWDSWGKITVLRDGFEAKLWGEAWENDLDHSEGETGSPSAKKMYAAIVPDQGAKPPPLPPFNNPTPEQAFLAKNYDENSKKPDRDPRGAFRNPNETAAAGIVGPMGSSSFNLPNVERALTDMEGGIGGGANPLATSTNGDPHESGPQDVRTPAAPSPSPSTATSPNAAGQTQHEVLQNFFQSLLSSKDRVASGAPATKMATSKSNESTNGTDEGS